MCVDIQYFCTINMSPHQNTVDISTPTAHTGEILWYNATFNGGRVQQIIYFWKSTTVVQLFESTQLNVKALHFKSQTI